MIDRIAKLLNQAERAATPEEAGTYFEKAQTLATTYSISLAKARLHTRRGQARTAPLNRTIRIGDARRHVNRHLVLLMSALAQANDLKLDIAHNSTFVVLYGFPDDITAAEALWVRIATQMVRFGEKYLNRGEWRSDTRLVLRDGYARSAAMTKQTARATYYGAFIDTVGGRIARARAAAVERAQADERTRNSEPGAPAAGSPASAGGEQSTALALRAKELAVTDYYTANSRARGTWGGARSRVVGVSESARAAGSRDARRVRLADPGELSGRRRALGA